MTRTVATLAGAVAACAGIGAAALVAPDDQPAPPATRVVHAGPALLTVPATWQRAGRSGSVFAPSPDSATRATVTFGPADQRSLLPRDLRAEVDGPPPRPEAALLGARPAVLYRDLRAGDRRLDVTVLPTTAGMLAVACAAPPGADSDRTECNTAIASASVPDATALIPSPAIPLATELPVAIERLDRATIAGRVVLGKARTPSAQAAAAAHLAGLHRDAAADLRAALGAPARATAAAIDRGAAAYAALSAAAGAGSPAAFAAARRDIRAAETTLTTAVAATLRDGTRPAPASAPTTPAAARSAGGADHSTQAILVALLLLGSLAAGFIASGPVARATARATARRRSAPT